MSRLEALGNSFKLIHFQMTRWHFGALTSSFSFLIFCGLFIIWILSIMNTITNIGSWKSLKKKKNQIQIENSRWIWARFDDATRNRIVNEPSARIVLAHRNLPLRGENNQQQSIRTGWSIKEGVRGELPWRWIARHCNSAVWRRAVRLVVCNDAWTCYDADATRMRIAGRVRVRWRKWNWGFEGAVGLYIRATWGRFYPSTTPTRKSLLLLLVVGGDRTMKPHQWNPGTTVIEELSLQSLAAQPIEQRADAFARFPCIILWIPHPNGSILNRILKKKNNKRKKKEMEKKIYDSRCNTAGNGMS